jgi:hypothetical protein
LPVGLTSALTRYAHKNLHFYFWFHIRKLRFRQCLEALQDDKIGSIFASTQIGVLEITF